LAVIASERVAHVNGKISDAASDEDELCQVSARI
jgi:hypothetical protein